MVRIFFPQLFFRSEIIDASYHVCSQSTRGNCHASLFQENLPPPATANSVFGLCTYTMMLLDTLLFFFLIYLF